MISEVSHGERAIVVLSRDKQVLVFKLLKVMCSPLLFSQTLSDSAIVKVLRSLIAADVYPAAPGPTV